MLIRMANVFKIIHTIELNICFGLKFVWHFLCAASDTSLSEWFQQHQQQQKEMKSMTKHFFFSFSFLLFALKLTKRKHYTKSMKNAKTFCTQQHLGP